MAEMLIQPVVKDRTVKEFDFIFSSGMVMPVSIDEEAGDSIHDDKDTIIVIITAKPSLSTPDASIPSERVVVYKAHLLAVQSRERTVSEPTPEDKFELASLYSKLAGSDKPH
jgi:hypothetical protein